MVSQQVNIVIRKATESDPLAYQSGRLPVASTSGIERRRASEARVTEVMLAQAA